MGTRHANNSLILPIGNNERDHCVYEHWAFVSADGSPPKNTLIYVGVCKLREVYLCPDARKNSSWAAYITAEFIIETRVIFTSSDISECYNEHGKIIREQRPYCNVYGARVSGQTVVTCIQTGKTYATATQAALNEGVSLSALCNHLNGKVGHNTVKGKTFRRGL